MGTEVVGLWETVRAMVLGQQVAARLIHTMEAIS